MNKGNRGFLLLATGVVVMALAMPAAASGGSTWMADTYGRISSHTLRTICVPGTHDAGMSTATTTTSWAAARSTVTQSYSVLKQLQTGARFLDIRPLLVGSTWWSGHFQDLSSYSSSLKWQGALGQSVASIMTELNNFTSSVKREVVVVYLSHGRYANSSSTLTSQADMTSAHWLQLFAVLSAGTNHLFTRTDGSDVTSLVFSSLVTSGPAVIFFVPTTVSLGTYSGNGFFQVPSDYYDSYSNTNDVDTMTSDQLSKMSSNCASTWFLLSWTLTQTTSDIIAKTSIISMASQANAVLSSKLSAAMTDSCYPNIILVDNLNDSTPLSLCQTIHNSFTFSCATISCNDSDECTTDTCSNTSGCINTQKVCDDSDSCTTDSCSAGKCIFTDMDCSDGDSCTNDTCVSGTCTHVNMSCSDGNLCTTDTCSGGVCFHAELDCDDDNNCTVDSCSAGVCYNTQMTCNDNNSCTVDKCKLGVCVFTNMSCDDYDGCTKDSCSAGKCIHTELTCSDSNSCTKDQCEDGTCYFQAISSGSCPAALSCSPPSSNVTGSAGLGTCTSSVASGGNCSLNCSSGYSANVGLCSNGTWILQPACEENPCTTTLNNSTESDWGTCTSQVASGVNCSLECNTGYEANVGSCRVGSWNPEPECIPHRCSVSLGSGGEGYGTCLSSKVSSGATCSLQCKTGYTNTSGTCSFGKWSSTPSCTANPCTLSSTLPSGATGWGTCSTSISSGKNCTYTCQSGATTGYCTAATWSPEPSCNTTGSCSLVLPTGASWNTCSSSVTSGTSCKFTCPSGYTATTGTCSNGKWEFYPVCVVVTPSGAAGSLAVSLMFILLSVILNGFC